MSAMGKILAWVCAVLFVVTGVLALLLFNVERRAFSAGTYKQAFENRNLYEQMPSVLAAALTDNIAGNPNADPYLKAVSQEGWERTIVSLLPPEEWKLLADDALDSVFDYLNGKTDSASISLLPFKRRLAGDSGVEAVKSILAAQPECTAEQLTQMGINLLSGGGMILCNPPAGLVEMFNPIIETQLQFMTIGFPDEITLIKGGQSGTANDPRIRLNRVRLAMKLSPVIPLIFLFGLTVFAVRRLVDWLKWWGVPFLVTGGTSALIGLLGAPILSLAMQRVIQNQGTGSILPVLFMTTKEAVGVAARQVLSPLVIQGALLVMTGTVMLIVVLYVSTRGTTPTLPS